jgi:3-oxoacyl-[acyl-carrier protein] reductase
MAELTGRVALVTGASRGIGRAIAIALAAQGAAVAVAARGDGAASVADEIVGAGGLAEAVTLDVTDRASVQRAVEIVIGRFGQLDILVNNAGIARDQLLLRLKPEDWDAVLATNLTAAYTCSQVALRPMLKRGGGRIINITSIVGETGNAGQANYAASKAGLIGFTKALALEVASRQITVNAVAPGWIDTDMTRGITDAARETWIARIPLNRLGRPEDVAAAVVFLASDEASYITGHVLAVNGGMHM